MLQMKYRHKRKVTIRPAFKMHGIMDLQIFTFSLYITKRSAWRAEQNIHVNLKLFRPNMPFLNEVYAYTYE